MTRSWAILAGGALVLLAGVVPGCTHSSASYPFERKVVWQVAVAETIVWGPNLIDEKKFLVTSSKTDRAGKEMLAWELRVVVDPNPFAIRPSTRAYVRIIQKSPKRQRYLQSEREFLARLGETLRAMKSAPSP
ncbi:hypothetical protein LCGC14_2831480 [marine sediment metagenome]|uniref:Uncharacterized protein n=1 Tax=marine sediment metagenome TaxID=412755 RepID=A0A0F9AMD8_9ZZZZ